VLPGRRERCGRRRAFSTTASCFTYEAEADIRTQDLIEAILRKVPIS
jgi:hypothetical protein